MAFVALGAPRPDMVGVGRLGDNLFSNCVLALDVLTGKRLWHFQDVRHDIWDLDVCAPPNLVTITREGKRVDVVTCMGKSGHLFVLDRVSGKPVFPVRLRRAPISKLPGERTAEYQPDPEWPEPISRSEFHPDMITNRSPEARAFVEPVVARSNYGFFAPFEEGKPTLFIGSRGGAEWSGAAVDVPTGRLYVTSNRWVSKITVMANDEQERDPRHAASAGEKIYVEHCASCHGPNRVGLGMVPPLIALKSRAKDADVLALLATGRGAMPPNLVLTDAQKKDLLDYLFRRNQPPTRRAGDPTDASGRPNYVFDGFGFLVDHEGYPGIKPPWGLLNCYDLSTGKALWRVPLGELEELTKQGVPKTGSQNLGGASVTAGGLVFVAGTADEKLRAFDVDTGAELWAAKLPFAGTAAPAAPASTAATAAAAATPSTPVRHRPPEPAAPREPPSEAPGARPEPTARWSKPGLLVRGVRQRWLDLCRHLWRCEHLYQWRDEFHQLHHRPGQRQLSGERGVRQRQHHLCRHHRRCEHLYQRWYEFHQLRLRPGKRLRVRGVRQRWHDLRLHQRRCEHLYQRRDDVHQLHHRCWAGQQRR
jgi:quinoprotein glucose dehydrogenase